MAQHKDRERKPSGGEIDFSTVPDELRILRQWVMWRFDWNVKSGSWAKVPYQTNGQHAASDNPETWTTFDAVMLTYEQAKSSWGGIGFMFSPDSRYVGVDVDECVTSGDGDLVLNAFAQRTMERLNTYTELSPSGTGIHCIGLADKFDGMNRTYNGQKIEAYSWGRYFTFTGRSWDEKPRPIREITADLTAIREAISKPSAESKSPELPQLSLSVEKRLEMALKDPKTNSLFWGNTAEHGGDDSAADMALCSKLAYYAQNVIDLDTMFRQSRLMRPKWDEMRGAQTYGAMTAGKAIRDCSRFLGSKPKKVEKVSDYDTRRLRRYTMLDLKEKAVEYYHNGQAKGVHPGWENLEPLYRPAKSMLSIITGEPGSGKSNWIDCLCYNVAHRHGWKVTFASFETLPVERHILTLCQIYLQKPTFAWMSYAATQAELEKAIDVLSPYFHFIYPDDHELNIEALLEYVEDDIRDYEIDGFVLDPFTELEQSRFGSATQTETIERILRKLQLFTRQRQIHTWLIAHPTKSGDTYKDGRPTMRSISGSANFYNKADFGLVVDRQEDDRTYVHVDKVRFDSNGQKGRAEFIYSKDRREYVAA